MHAFTPPRQHGRALHVVPALALIVGLCLAWAPAFLANNPGGAGTSFQPAAPQPPRSPRSAAMSQSYAYPGAGGQLWQNATHNLTAGLRDDAAWGRTYEGGYLEVNESGTPYSNTSLVPPGTFDAAYSFTDDNIGAIPYDWTSTASLPSLMQVEEIYAGHSKVIAVHDLSDFSTCGGNQRFRAPPQTSGSISFWVLDDSSSSEGQRLVLILSLIHI